MAATVVGVLAVPWAGELPSPPSGASAVPLASVIVVAATVMVRRYVRLFRIGHQGATAATAIALAWLGAGSAIGALSAVGSVRWWVAHGIDSVSVLGAAAALIVLWSQHRSVGEMLVPVVRHDPVPPLELGLLPAVHAFVAALDRRDRSTRDHVIRVADLAVRVAARAGLPASQLRRVRLGAMLHDIGKLVVPS